MTTAYIFPVEKNFADNGNHAPKRTSASGLRVLIVVEDESRFDLVRAHFVDPEPGRGAVHWLAHYETARDALFREAYDVAVLDSRHHGLELLRDMARGGTDTPAIVLIEDENPTRDAAGVTCEFLARTATDDGRLQRAIRDVVGRARTLRTATRSQSWWRCGGRTLSHATAFPVPAENHRIQFVDASTPSSAAQRSPHARDDAVEQTTRRSASDPTVSGGDRLLSEILDHLPIIAGQLDEDGTIRDCGGSGLKSVGLSPEALRGQNIFACPGVPAAAIRQAAHGTPVKFVCTWVVDGKPRHFECHLRIDASRPRGVAGFAYDVTERIEAELARERREQLLAGILRHLPAIVGRLDAAGDISEVDGAGLTQRGLEARRLQGARFIALFPEGAKAVDCALAGGATRFEASVNSGTAEEGCVEFNLFFDRERGAGAVFFGQDVTARRGLERQLLHAVDAERHRIGADLHDDVGQLLTGIACLSTALVERLRGRDDLAAEDATTVARVANDALAQVRSLARGLAPVDLARRGLPEALADLRQHVRRMHDVDVNLQVPAACVDFDRETAAHLLRIVQEATANAIRHGEATRIDVSLRRCGGEHRLAIADNGCGFDPQRPRRGSGSGLGLMEYRAALIGGDFSVSSDRHGGTRIEISFTPTDPCPHENAC